MYQKLKKFTSHRRYKRAKKDGSLCSTENRRESLATIITIITFAERNRLIWEGDGKVRDGVGFFQPVL